ncbi:MAG: DUF2723 domain-containing protein, partial [bacterium]
MERLLERLKTENAFAVLAVSISFLVYSTTLCPTVTYIDSGELAAVASTIGIAHPTGYPLFTMIGRIMVMIPMGLEAILQLNLMSAILTALAVGLFYKLSWLVLTITQVAGTSASSSAEKRGAALTVVLTGTLSFAFGTTIWTQSAAIEVYSLHIFLLTASLFCFLKGIVEQKENPENISRWLILSFFVTGLAFTNHMTMILIIPAMLFLFLVKFGWGKESLILASRSIPFFFIGCSLYLVLPIRSTSNPLLDWGHPAELTRFFWHIS